MRKILLATLAAAAVFAAVPASAQLFMGAGHGGAGVQVGPFGFGVSVAVSTWLVPASRVPVSGLRDR